MQTSEFALKSVDQSVSNLDMASAPGESRRVVVNAFRQKRIAHFLPLVDRVLAQKSSCRILDIGGEGAYWRDMRGVLAGRKLDVTIVNLEPDDGQGGVGVTHAVGNACDLRHYADRAFDIVHSNSVIEHVGAWSHMQAMAGEIRRLAPAYFVQTPNYWFPLEPHLRVPFIHWIPRPWRQRIVMARACGAYPRAASVAEAQTILADASLLDHSMFATLFPDARIVREHIGPLTKSFMALRD